MAQQGAAPASNPQATRPVAAWDVVPFQVFDKPFHVGVVAFHETGCKVEFTVRAGGADGPARTQTIENPTLNSQSNVWEYWFALDPHALPDGPVEVRAKVIPLGEGMIVRELAALTLYANGRGSLKFGAPVWVDCDQGDDAADATEAKPLKTLAAAIRKSPDGGTIYLKAGKGYSAHALEGGFQRTYWTVDRGGPGRETRRRRGRPRPAGHRQTLLPRRDAVQRPARPRIQHDPRGRAGQDRRLARRLQAVQQEGPLGRRRSRVRQPLRAVHHRRPDHGDGQRPRRRLDARPPDRQDRLRRLHGRADGRQLLGRGHRPRRDRRASGLPPVLRRRPRPRSTR